MELECELRVILAKKDMRLKDLAIKTDLNYNYLSDLNNKRKEPGIYNALLIANALNVRVEEIWYIKKITCN